MPIQREVLYTFKNIEPYNLKSLIVEEPFANNKEIGAVKYKITVEVIEDDISDVKDRLERLLRSSAYKEVISKIYKKAKELDITLSSVPGCEVKSIDTMSWKIPRIGA